MWHVTCMLFCWTVSPRLQDQANFETQSRIRKLSDPEMCVKTPRVSAMQSAVTENALIPPE